jgi:hypothetical protein
MKEAPVEFIMEGPADYSNLEELNLNLDEMIENQTDEGVTSTTEVINRHEFEPTTATTVNSVPTSPSRKISLTKKMKTDIDTFSKDFISSAEQGPSIDMIEPPVDESEKITHQPRVVLYQLQDDQNWMEMGTGYCHYYNVTKYRIVLTLTSQLCSLDQRPLFLQCKYNGSCLFSDADQK